MNNGKKDDTGKIRLDLMPPEAIRALGAVLTFGAEKYGPNQWRGVEMERYEAALLRHWLAWKEGERLDPESGLPHLAHLLCNAAFLVALDPISFCVEKAPQGATEGKIHADDC